MIQLRHLLWFQLYPGSSNILLKIGAPLRPWDWNDVVALAQQPCQGDLSRRRFLALGNLLHHRGSAHVRIVIRALKSGIAATEISFGIFFRAFGGTRQEAPAQR